MIAVIIEECEMTADFNVYPVRKTSSVSPHRPAAPFLSCFRYIFIKEWITVVRGIAH
jgi:hypothetical protein